MKLEENLSLKGNWNFVVTDGAPLSREEWKVVMAGKGIGREYNHQNVNNVITLPFRSALASLLSRPPADAFLPFRLTHQELGTGDTPANENDSALETPDPSTFTLLGDVVPVAKEIQITGFYPEGGASGHWKEYGIWLNGDGERVLFNRVNIDRNIGGASSLSIFGVVNFNI